MWTLLINKTLVLTFSLLLHLFTSLLNEDLFYYVNKALIQCILCCFNCCRDIIITHTSGGIEEMQEQFVRAASITFIGVIFYIGQGKRLT